MGGSNEPSILKSLDMVKEEIAKRERPSVDLYDEDVFVALKNVLEDPNFEKTWSLRSTNSFFQEPNIEKIWKRDGKAKRENLFKINVMLSWQLSIVAKHSCLSVRSWPTASLFFRQYLSVNKTEEVFVLLGAFHSMLNTLANKNFNISVTSEHLMPYLILRLISIDGILIGHPDLKIAELELDHIHLDGAPYIRINTGRRNSKKKTFKSFPITKKTAYFLKILSNRAKKLKGKKYIFPSGWREVTKKKCIRRKALEEVISELWKETHSGGVVHTNIDIPIWLNISRSSFEMLGMPYVCIGSMVNKIRGAQIPPENIQSLKGQAKAIKTTASDKRGLKLIYTIQHAFNGYDLKSTKIDDRRAISKSINKIIEDAGELPVKWIYNAKWIAWLIDNKELRELSLSTIKMHTSTVSNRILLEFDSDNLFNRPNNFWQVIAESIAGNEDYCPSTRRTTLTHLRRFHKFLKSTDPSIPDMDWGSHKLRVYRDFAECAVLYPHEVDSWLESLPIGSKEWFSGILGFYCGLRCEEIFNLTPKSFESDYRLVVSRSKLNSSRRTLPISWLVPERLYDELTRQIDFLSRQYGEDKFIVDPNNKLEGPSSLSKSVGRSMRRFGLRVSKMHALRHGFASWMLVRYFMITDPLFDGSFRAGEVCPSDCLIEHGWFQSHSLENLSLMFGGIIWLNEYLNEGQCIRRSIDISSISKLLGHASRFTTLENYTNSLQWIQRYYINQRDELISNARWSFSAS